MIGEKQKLSLYMHTHWDREWYWAFERYRTALVTAMKLIVKALEDNELPSFHLDGQVCALDDFLELEPSYEERIKKLAAKNKLSIGPWYVLADQMLVSGESLIRNLEVGMAHTRRYGKPMMVGYCPDTFGHSQDLPRILKGFGIENAVVWRGAPELGSGPEFSWKSPDGSEVIALLLAKGYHQTLFHEAEGSVDDERIDVIVENLLPWLGLRWDKETGAIVENPDGSLVYSRHALGCLVPVGGDHQKPPANLTAIIKKVEARIAALLKPTAGRKDAKISSIDLDPVQLQDYLKMVAQAVQKPAVPLRLIEGELRENSSALAHGAAYMLPGILSTRLYLKRANRVLEHRLSRISEPLYSLMSLSGLSKYPASELDNCWRYMLKNHPHDSMCGCSVDDVHREMMTRFASVHQVLDVLDQRVRQDVLVPGVHEWSHDRLKKPKVDSKKTSRASEGKRLENAGFGRGSTGLADPDVPLSGLAVFNLSLDKVCSPVKVTLAIPSKYFDNSKGSSSVVANAFADQLKSDSGANQFAVAVAERSSTQTAETESKSTIEAENLRFSEEEIQIAASRYLADIGGDKSNFQIDFVKFETELFGETCGVPLYKDVHFVECWMWSGSVAPFGVKLIDFKNKVASSSNSVGQLVNKIVQGAVGFSAEEFPDLSVKAPNEMSFELAANSQSTDGASEGPTPEGSETASELQDVMDVTVSPSNISNGIFDVSVAVDGRLTVTAINAQGTIEQYELEHKLQDVADAGDSYNFDPIKDDTPVVAAFQSCAVGKSGPLVGSLILTYKIAIPSKVLEPLTGSSPTVDAGVKDLNSFVRSSETVEHEIVTKISLKRGEPILFFETSWLNKSLDHRLEVVFKTGAPVKVTWSENHFSLVERKVSEHQVMLPAEKYTESPLDRFPCQRFFVANGQGFFNLGLPEYGVAGDSVSITILRAISMLSRKRLLTRGGGAGPYMPVPEGNCIGENVATYGWAPLAVAGLHPALPSNQSKALLDDSSRANAYRLAERFEGALWATPLTAESESVLQSVSAVTLDNARIRGVAAYSNDRGKSILLRLLNTAMTSQDAVLSLGKSIASVERVDLAGQKQSVLAMKDVGSLKLTFGSNELITLRIHPKV